MTVSFGAGFVAARPPPEPEAPPTRLRPLLEASPEPPPGPTDPNVVLARLLRLHYDGVWRTLRRLGVEPGRVDDAAQEVFIVAARKLHLIEAGRERSFLLSSAVRVAANYRRSGRARREVTDDGLLEDQSDPRLTADQLLYRKRLRQLLDSVLSEWPEEIRTAFVLFELEGMSMPEIAEITETKLGTVASRIRRARELFQSAVKRLKARGLIEPGGG